jgi:hypothetical protein
MVAPAIEQNGNNLVKRDSVTQNGRRFFFELLGTRGARTNPVHAGNIITAVPAACVG